MCAFKRKKSLLGYWKVYFTMPNITVNLKLKARNIRDFLKDKPMPKQPFDWLVKADLIEAAVKHGPV